ncbi:MAG: hypothetical protein CM1200mP20_11100 [Pseudomonadota bacterium]|nr:MAG: hypothetical protein CM1200mP20_11100 [Pseudomonadota bacterium]
MAIPLIAMTGHPESTLGRAAEVYLDTSVEREACPHNLAPTTSTTATLAMGDALAVAILKSGVSAGRTSPAHIRAVFWADACWSMSVTSCTRAMTCPCQQGRQPDRSTG